MHRSKSLTLSVALLLASAPAFARAQDSAAAQNAADDPATTAAARALAIDGVKLVQAGRCADAVEKLARAERLHHAPIVLQNLGACEIEQGRLVEGTEALRKVLREPLPAKPSPALRKAYERAQTILDQAKPNIALLTIALHVAGEEPSAAGEVAATVTLDGQSVPPALLGSERPTDPGEHVLEASAPGFVPARANVKLAPAERQRLVLTLERAAQSAARDTDAVDQTDVAIGAGAPLPASAALGPATAARAASEHGARDHTAAYAAFATGAVALAIGAGFGIAALVRTNELESSCDGIHCPAGVRGKLDTTKQLGTISTIAFAAAAGAGVLGALLYLTTGAGAVESERASPHARLGLGSAELRVAF